MDHPEEVHGRQPPQIAQPLQIHRAVPAVRPVVLELSSPGLNKTIESYDIQLTTLKRKIDFNNSTIFQQTQGLEKERKLLGVDSEQEQSLPIEQLIESLVAKGPQQIGKFEDILKSTPIRKCL
jgi:hypothetical protein